jgi:hypothetical protein
MPEEAKESKPQSWWQSLPGTLTAVAGILTALTGLIVAISQSGRLWKSEPTGTATFSGSPMTSKGSVSSVSFPLSEIRIVDSISTADRDLAYKIVAASLGRSDQVRNMLTITFIIRVTNNGRTSCSINARFFRLIADGDVVAPGGSALAYLPEGSSDRATVSFSFLETTTSAQLQVGEIDQKTVRLPLSLKVGRR